MNKLKVGDKLRFTVDHFDCADEVKGAIVEVVSIREYTFATTSTDKGGSWSFLLSEYQEGLELVEPTPVDTERSRIASAVREALSILESPDGDLVKAVGLLFDAAWDADQLAGKL